MLFVILLAASTVSATDNVTDDVVGVEETNDVLNIEDNQNNDFYNTNQIDDKLSVSESNQLNYALDDGSFKDLNDDIANATGELNLSRDYVFDSSRIRDLHNVYAVFLFVIRILCAELECASAGFVYLAHLLAVVQKYSAGGEVRRL